MNPIFLTLFTPTYNRAHSLHRVYESIKAQTLQKVDGKYIFEWVVVDDGSEDNTKALVRKWQKEVGFPILYFYQKNQGKPAASRKGIEEAKGELFLFADSDDEFLPETFKTFYEVWKNFDAEERNRCGGIGVLCVDQNGNRIGCDYPIERKLIPSTISVFEWKNIGLGETWAALKTENLKKAFVIPEEAKSLKFIPESFFWNRIVFELRPESYLLNKILRIYYKNEIDSISENIRKKHPEGFLFESKWFVTKYWRIAWKYPKIFIKHAVKFIYFTWRIKNESK